MNVLAASLLVATADGDHGSQLAGSHDSDCSHLAGRIVPTAYRQVPEVRTLSGRATFGSEDSFLKWQCLQGMTCTNPLQTNQQRSK